VKRCRGSHAKVALHVTHEREVERLAVNPKEVDEVAEAGS
jgi:hypothetical protein